MGTKVSKNPKHWYHFGCPVFVLVDQLQSGSIWHKWRSRSHIGIYLGRSPLHSRTVALVLHAQTGYVSPQFHVKMDPSFHSVREATRQEQVKILWPVKTGFISEQTRIDTKKAKPVVSTRRPPVRAPIQASEGASEGARAQLPVQPQSPLPPDEPEDSSQHDQMVFYRDRHPCHRPMQGPTGRGDLHNASLRP